MYEQNSSKIYTETTAKIILGLGVTTALLLILLLCVCICKDFYQACCLRNRNRVLEEDAQNTQAIEMLSPDLVDVARGASILAGALVTMRRRQLNLGDDITSGNVSNDENDTDTQLRGEVPGASNSGDGDKQAENRGPRLKRKRRVTFNLEDDDEAGSSSKDKNDDQSKSLDSSGLTSSSDDDTVAKVEEVSSKDDGASNSRTGGGDARAPSPWVDF